MRAWRCSTRSIESTRRSRPRARTRTPRPHSCLQGPGENAEWFAFSAPLIATADSGAITAGWIALSGEEGGRRRPGTAIALGNMRRGLRPPQSGHDNPHYFDDLAMVRAIGRRRCTTTSRRHESSPPSTPMPRTTWTGCGRRMPRWCCSMRSVTAHPDRMRHGLPAAALPAESWTRRLTDAALETAENMADPLGLAVALGREVCDWIYSYPVAAPETLAVLLAHVSVAPDATALLLGTGATGRNGTTLAALAGAAAAALFGGGWIPAEITLDSPLAGISVPRLAGTTLTDAIGRRGL
ncbi:hypothetical protein [Microbacterium elymi]|uniref:Uncharacterized protein n=1 Tax=Microbacterium elymi TaxID=2909587 RepID=A0ABY5NHR1_9MICO|nr:hypothetical protein [Microbacterium elymi]UUT34631.1 hypothetical protein L2X98_29480 [Microbacterium elymi]